MLLSRPGVSPRMVGRQREIAELGRLIGESHRQRGPAVAVVTGEAGVGKTRLLRELVATTPPETRVLASQAHEGDTARPFAMIRDAVEGHLPGDGELPGALERWAHPLGHLLTPLVRLRDHPQDGHTHGEEELARAAVALVSHLVGHRQALVVFEDLHWADAASLEVFARLARSDVPALLVGTFRPEDFDRRHPLGGLLAAVERQRPVVHVPVERLSRAELAELLELACGRPVDRTVVDRLHRRTQGNPFFVEELLLAAEQPVDPGRLVETPLPWNTTEAALRRLDGYDAATKAILRAAAVLGERFSLPLLAHVSGVDEEGIAGTVGHLVHGGVLVERGPDVFGFRHVLQREAVAAELLSRDRQALHERALSWLIRNEQDEPGLAAYHAAEAGREREAAEYARIAAGRALHGGAPRNALGLARQALNHLDDDVALHALAAHAAAQIGDLDEATWHAERWAAAAARRRDATEQARAHCQLVWMHQLTGQPDRAWDAADAATDLAERLEPAEQAKVAAARVQLLAISGRGAKAIEEADRAIELAELAEDRRTRAHVYVSKASAMVDSLEHQQPERLEEAAELAQHAVEESAALGDIENLSRALHVRLVPDQPVELDLEEVQGILAEANELADRYGLERFAGKLAVVEAYWYVHEGLLAEADGALASARRAPLWPPEVAWRERLDAYLLLEQGDIDGAREVHAAQREHLAGRSSVEADFEVAATTSGIAAHVGDPAAAEAALRHVGAIIAEVCPCVAAEWWEIAVGALDAGTDPTLVRQLMDLHAPPPILRHAGLIAYAAGCLHAAEGKADQAIDDLQRSVAAPRRGRRAAMLADTHRRLAELCAARGDRAAARAHVGAGLGLLTRWPGNRLAGLEALERRIGGPEQPSHALFTPRELDVVRLLTRGCSNSEIAEQLFITRKTVSTHVSNILTKTGFDSRTQVATWALQEGIVDQHA